LKPHPEERAYQYVLVARFVEGTHPLANVCCPSRWNPDGDGAPELLRNDGPRECF